MTAVINGVVVTGMPEEIKVLMDLYTPPEIFASNNTKWFIDHKGKCQPIGKEKNNE